MLKLNSSFANNDQIRLVFDPIGNAYVVSLSTRYVYFKDTIIYQCYRFSVELMHSFKIMIFALFETAARQSSEKTLLWITRFLMLFIPMFIVQ